MRGQIVRRQAASWRPRPWHLAATAALVAALAGYAVAVWPWDSFLSAALVGLSQGWLLRRMLGGWWSWTMTTAIAGGAALAIVRLFANLGSVDAGAIASLDILTFTVLRSFCAGAVIGACQAFLLAGRYRGVLWWVAASAVGAALFWTSAFLASDALAKTLNAVAAGATFTPIAGVSIGRLTAAMLVNALTLALSWGGVAVVVSRVLPRLHER